MRLAFVANLDAELELMRPHAYRPSSRMRAGIAPRAAHVQQQLARCLDATVDLLVPGGKLPPPAAFDAGVCWCPTPAAQRLLAQAGAPTSPAPPLDVLQRVNHRAFGAALSPQLPGARFVRSLDELDALLAAPRPPLGHLVKRPFGFAGRGRKHLPPDAHLAGPLRTWAAASMHDYGVGLQVEPRVAIVAEFAIHGIVDRAGHVLLGHPTRQETDADGAWLATTPTVAADLSRGEHDALAAAAHTVTGALHLAGYFGPFGIDAYRYRTATGALAFHALGEINARLTMGFCTGLGPAARALL